MEAKYLQSTEIRYECEIRGIKFSEHDNGKSSLVFLNAILQKEYLNIDDPPKSSSFNFNQARELEVCSKLAKELTTLFRETGLTVVLNSRLIHLFGRFRRINSKSVEFNRYTLVHQEMEELLQLVETVNLPWSPLQQNTSMTDVMTDDQMKDDSPNQTLIQNEINRLQVANRFHFNSNPSNNSGFK